MEGLGTTIDVILVNGVLNEGDTIVVCGMNGPITTTIRALLTPQPMKEMRVKGSYVHHKTIQAAQGVKICAQDLDKAIAGSSLFVLRSGDDIQAIEVSSSKLLMLVVLGRSHGRLGRDEKASGHCGTWCVGSGIYIGLLGSALRVFETV